MATTRPGGSGTSIGERLAAGPTLSFEFFPPKSDEAERKLEKAISELAPLEPSFVSVTYGAGGSTRDRTRDIVLELAREQSFPDMPHLTCVGHTREDGSSGEAPQTRQVFREVVSSKRATNAS